MTYHSTRRTLLASAGTVAIAGCVSGDDSNGEGNTDSSADDDPGDSKEGRSPDDFEIHEGELLGEEQPLAIAASLHEHDSLRYSDGDSLDTLRPQEDRFLRASVAVAWHGELESRPPAPEPADVALVSLENGIRFEALEWPYLSVNYYELREEGFGAYSAGWTSDLATVAPVFDAPAGAMAIDVSEILGREDPVLIQ